MHYNRNFKDIICKSRTSSYHRHVYALLTDQVIYNINMSLSCC
nr:MAG TPA: hypothetical protein [Bacteriophage sp.]